MSPNSSIAIPGPSSKGKEEAEPENVAGILERYSQALTTRSVQGSGATQNADKVLHRGTSATAPTSGETVLLADANGEIVLRGDAGMATLEATQGINIKCGGVSIVLTPASISLKNGTASIELSPANVNINHGALEVI